MPGRLHFHQQMNASVTGFTQNGIPYLRRVAGYIAKCFQTNVIPWCLDQIALSCVLRQMQTEGTGPRAIAVGPTVYDGTFDAMLMPQKCTQDSPHHERWKQEMARFAA
jgi:hypothetical protein